MHHLEQLKKIRSEALARIRRSEDYNVAAKVGQLVVELGGALDDVVGIEATPTAKSGESRSKPFEDVFGKPSKGKDTDDDDAAIQGMVAELEDGVAELDAMAEDQSAESTASHFANIGKFLNGGKSDGQSANGAAH